MAVSRASIVDGRFCDLVATHPARSERNDLDSPVLPGSSLTARRALQLFEAQIESRLLDLLARDLKADGNCFYTIASSGHEGNAAVGGSLHEGDLSFLHYRSGAYYLARAQNHAGPSGAFDVILGLVASADEPIAGGRHKVFGSVPLGIPPQTSTIASHLPKAVGCAIALDRRARFEQRPETRVVVCTFGDASSNHSTAQGALNTAAWANHQRVPCPCLFVCENNGLGISVRTPSGWIGESLSNRPGIPVFDADGCSLPDAWDAAQRALAYVRTRRAPAILHLRVVRLLGHAGSDVEQLYRTRTEIEDGEAQDPVLATARLLIDNGWLQPSEVLALYEETRNRLRALAEEALRRPKIETRAEVMEPLYVAEPCSRPPLVASDEARARVFRTLPEDEERPRHMAVQLNRAMKDLLAAIPEAIVFGEDVARKGGVYHVTADLMKLFGVGRVFNTLLDEQAILGLAIGAGHAGLLPIPEIQYLAYLMNAIDQLRGEAASMQFFSQGQFQNPMVIRIASLAYQKGFGGHFHNDNGIAALLEIPGLLIGCPARGDDAVRMLRTLVATAREQGRVCIFLEPIARYMTKHLHEEEDGGWLTAYPAPDEQMPVGEIGVYDCEGPPELCIATYGNGLWMSLRVQKRLAAEGHRVRVVDLRWLMPLPIEALRAQVDSRLLVVDECRANSGIADKVVAEIVEASPHVRTRRVTGADTYIPLGAAANLVLVQEAEIDSAARALMEVPCPAH